MENPSPTGANEDLWIRAREAWHLRPDTAIVEVQWTPSHADESPELLVTDRQLETAAGNAAADIWAREGAELAWESGLVGEDPQTDRIDAIASL
eukprot:6356053-Pyramimonas_sp.AAC.1